jgi:hypothetical protein
MGVAMVTKRDRATPTLYVRAAAARSVGERRQHREEKKKERGGGVCREEEKKKRLYTTTTPAPFSHDMDICSLLVLLPHRDTHAKFYCALHLYKRVGALSPPHADRRNDRGLPNKRAAQENKRKREFFESVKRGGFKGS